MRFAAIAILLDLFVVDVAYSKDLECISTMSSQVCVGESHDSVLEKLPKSSAIGQTVTMTNLGPRVDRDYKIGNEVYTITFGRTVPDGPHRVLKIQKRQ